MQLVLVSCDLELVRRLIARKMDIQFQQGVKLPRIFFPITWESNVVKNNMKRNFVIKH